MYIENNLKYQKLCSYYPEIADISLSLYREPICICIRRELMYYFDCLRCFWDYFIQPKYQLYLYFWE